jgi:hypothetical protein
MSRLKAIISGLERHENLNKSDMPMVILILKSYVNWMVWLETLDEVNKPILDEHVVESKT